MAPEGTSDLTEDEKRLAELGYRKLVKLLARGNSKEGVRLIRDHIEGTEHILAGLLPRPA